MGLTSPPFYPIESNNVFRPSLLEAFWAVVILDISNLDINLTDPKIIFKTETLFLLCI